MESEFRRKAPRRPFDGQVGVLYKGYMTISHCTQIGEGGALIESREIIDSLVEGEDIILTFFLPNIGGVVAYSKCVYRSDNNKIGIQFGTLSTAYKKKIREFVSRRKVSEVF